MCAYISLHLHVNACTWCFSLDHTSVAEVPLFLFGSVKAAIVIYFLVGCRLKTALIN